MKTKALLIGIFVGATSFFAAQNLHAQDIDSFAPVIVKTVPEAVTKNVPPGECEIKITFSKEMKDQSWSWSSAWENSDPQGIGKPHYSDDHKTCVLKVKLEPGKTYGYWLNSQNFHNFKDSQGHPAVPYLLTFQTASEGPDTTQSAQAAAASTPPYPLPAVNAAQSWLELIDVGDYDRSWKDASAFFQANVTSTAWHDSLVNIREPMGDLLHRQIKSAHAQTTMPGAPDGQYVITQWESSFTHKQSAIETVTFLLDADKGWKACGYYIK